MLLPWILVAPASATPLDPSERAPVERAEHKKPKKPAPKPATKPAGTPVRATRVEPRTPSAQPAQPDLRRPTPATRVPSTPHPATPATRPRLSVQRQKVTPRPELSSAKRSYLPVPHHPPARPPVDHRYARPRAGYVRPSPHHAPPPRARYYQSWYGHWWMHPLYRYTHVTYVVVGFPFVPDPWTPTWVPPHRPGWTWVPGYWAFGWWHPGYWAPITPVTVRYHVHYLYVPGWWSDGIYIEGYNRIASRPGWVWVEGHYQSQGRYVAGHWRPVGPAPEGYVWEPGFYDGDAWVEGFWRPQLLAGFAWVSSSYDEDGLYRAGYWEPVEPRPGHVWVPGWFDGESWQRGEWMEEAAYQRAATEAYEPPEGWNDGWDQDAPEPVDPDEAPLAIGVMVDDD